MKKYSKKIIGLLVILIGVCSLLIGNFSFKNTTYQNNTNIGFSILANSKEDVVYMSDLDYITDNNWSYNGWSGHSIQKDKNPEGGTISLLVNSSKKIFIKGMGVHANGQVTYDVSNISNNYSRFIARVGVDSSRGTNGSVKFKFFVSNDGNTWNELLTTDVLKGDSESVSVDLNIANYKYFRIFVDRSINGNTADHGVIAIGKFVKADYVDSSVTSYDKLKEVSYYDNILNQNDVDYNLSNNYGLILKREIVSKIGYDVIEALIDYSSIYQDFFDWVVSNNERMEQIIEVGEVNGMSFVTVLADLYENNKNALNEIDGAVYQKMMIGLAAAYSTDYVSSALQFSHKKADYDYLERFQIYKELYDNGSMTIYKPYFKNYHVELMRLVMSDGARNDEIKWLNYYTRSKDNNQSVYAYVNHTGTGVGYNDDEFYKLEYQQTQEEAFHLSQYGVPFGDNIQRYWMVIKKGGICWNQSRVFQSLFNSIGSPTIGAYQPGHEASFYYLANEDGTGKWNIANNIFGWGKTGTTWYGGNRFRTIFNWANKSFTNQMINGTSAGNSGGYLYLAQDNLNNYSKYKKSLYINLLANSYSDNNQKVAIYEKAIEEMNINLDSYDYLIQTYKEMDSASENDWYHLALKIIDNYTYYPMAMNDMLKVIKPYLTNEKRVDIDNKEYQALKLATKATSAEVSHDLAAREIASVLLGSVDGNIATFSFDGENKNKIVLNKSYEGYDLAWHYSLDGGVTKSEAISEKSYELTGEEVKQITEAKDILIYIDGLDVNTPSYIIDIEKKNAPDNLYNNDLENKVMGITDDMEWRIVGTEEWKKYQYETPDLTGNTSVQIRFGASENKLASDAVSFDFTEDIVDPTKKYIPVSYLNLYGVSSQATGSGQNGFASNAIDGNYNTRWHSAWDGSDTQKFITIQFNRSVHLSQIDFIPAGGGNGRIIDGTVEGSMDGVNWFQLAEIKNLQYTGNQNAYDFGKNNIKNIATDSTKEVSYVRITATNTSGGNFFAARMFNFYQDTTKSGNPTAGIHYSTTTPTNQNVVATLIDYDADNIEVLSDGGTTHTFTQNEEFEFIIRDLFTGNKSSILAKVDWIDKDAPIGTITYNVTSKTNNSVIATLTTNEEVTILNNKDASYEFVENGEFTFEFIDKAGNKGTALAKVDWIDRKTPVATLIYDNVNKTNKDVSVKIIFDKSNVTILNNDGKDDYTFTQNGEFTFEYMDEAGNHGSIIARVNWIDKELPKADVAVDKTNSNFAIVKVISSGKNITFEKGNGTYEFTKNGIYEIVFYDDLGNQGSVTVKIDWLKDSDADHTSDKDNITKEDSDSIIKNNDSSIENDNHSKVDQGNNKKEDISNNLSGDSMNRNDDNYANKDDKTNDNKEDVNHVQIVKKSNIKLYVITAIILFIVILITIIKFKNRRDK